MQKDIHFYATACLGKAIGLDDRTALLVAWADQYTDENQGDPFPTQTYEWGLWRDPMIQRDILCPFHFVPGRSGEHPTAVVSNGAIVRHLVAAAVESRDPLRVGIALHGLQDSYAHRGFSGFRETLNSCYPWYDPRSVIPNVGHAEEGPRPDIAHLTWTDYRTGEIVRNPDRCADALYQSARALMDFVSRIRSEGARNVPPLHSWILGVPDYERRKAEWRRAAGAHGLYLDRFSNVDSWLRPEERGRFLAASQAHRAAFVEAVAARDRKENGEGGE